MKINSRIAINLPIQKPSIRKIYKFNPCHFSLNLGRRTAIMGVVNATPDSFSQDGVFNRESSVSANRDAVVRKALRLAREGAHIIDIGGESSRPGAESVSDKEEIKRVIPAILALKSKLKIPISIDTYKLAVAQEALEAGASIVNTIKGATVDMKFLKMVARYKAGIVLMHMKGVPKTMQRRVFYRDLISEISASLGRSMENCLEMGINSDKIIIDPGIGFGKSVEDNLKVLNRLHEFKRLNAPILIGTSRKSFIGKILQKDVNNRLEGTLASVCLSVLKGAHIVRVHDVKKIRDAVCLSDALVNERNVEDKIQL